MTKEVETSKHRCPRCGSPLLYDGNHYWCSFVGGDREKACAFGIDKPVSDLALEDGPEWFSPFAWPRWARIAFAVTLPISGPLWIVAFMVGGVLTMAAVVAAFCIAGPVCLAIELFRK